MTSATAITAEPDPDSRGDHAASRSSNERLTPLRELQLLDRYEAGDVEAMAELLGAYQRRIYSVCYRMLGNVEEATDLTQDAIVKILEGLNTYDRRARLSTWIIRVSMNCCLSHLRRQKVRRHRSLDEPAAEGGGSRASRLPGPEELSGSRRVEQAELREILLRGLAGLDPEMRAVMVLRDLQDLDYQQIAEVMEVPVGTVKSRLFRARNALRDAVDLESSRGGREQADLPDT
ncbi:MAG: RNA polymerase sigma factor [Planctomycetota bacterium]